MAVLIAILGVSAIITMPVDIFPYIDIPVVSVVWSYGGLSPEEMEKRIVTFFERSLTTTVNEIEHIESQSYSGVAVIRVYLPAERQSGTGGGADHRALADAVFGRCRQAPFRPTSSNTTPPAVPILQLGLESQTMSEQELFDMGQNFIRTQLATIQGASVPLPYGGRFRGVMVDLNPDACSPNDFLLPMFRPRWAIRT